MIEIEKSPTADTRTCDFKNVGRQELLDASRQHIADVAKAMAFFSSKLFEAAAQHDYDKLTEIDWFHADFMTGFSITEWWDHHRKIHRHHLGQADGIPSDVNLLDVLEWISDCVMAGMARSGSIYPLEVNQELLQRAFKNTVELLKAQVKVSGVADVQKDGIIEEKDKSVTTKLFPHQQRVVDEKYELDKKRQSLEGFFLTDLFRALDQAEKDRLRTQFGVMGVYSDILHQRIAAFPAFPTAMSSSI